MNFSTASDELLFLKIKENNSLAFDHVFSRYYKKLCLFSGNMIKNNDLAQEVVQEVFIKIWQNRAEININKNLKSYLYRSVYYTSLNFIRDNKSKICSLEENPYGYSVESNEKADNAILYNELEARLFEVIDQFPEKQKNVFILRRFENLSYKEIAQKLNMSEKMVEKYLSKSLASLRLALSDYKKPYPGYFIFFI